MDTYDHYKAAARALLARKDIGAFYSVGLSMSLVIAAAQDEQQHKQQRSRNLIGRLIVRLRKHDHRTFGYLACSSSDSAESRFMERISVSHAKRRNKKTILFKPIIDLSDYKTKQKLRGYRKYLEQQGITPETLVKNYKLTYKRTAFVDTIGSGVGMSIFLVVLADWSKERGVAKEVAESITVIAYPENEHCYRSNKSLRSINISYDHNTSNTDDNKTPKPVEALFKVACSIVEDREQLWIHANGDDITKRQRAVPSYSFKEWEHLPADPDQAVISGFLNDYRAHTRGRLISRMARRVIRTILLT